VNDIVVLMQYNFYDIHSLIQTWATVNLTSTGFSSSSTPLISHTICLTAISLPISSSPRGDSLAMASSSQQPSAPVKQNQRDRYFISPTLGMSRPPLTIDVKSENLLGESSVPVNGEYFS
jgi:hypothetical protein